MILYTRGIGGVSQLVRNRRLWYLPIVLESFVDQQARGLVIRWRFICYSPVVAVLALKWRVSVRGELGRLASRAPKKPAVLHVAQSRLLIRLAKALLSREATGRRKQGRKPWVPPLREDRHRMQPSTWAAAKVRGVTFYHRIWPLFGGL